MNTQQKASKYLISKSILKELSEKIDDYEGYIDTEIEDGEMLITFKGYYDVLAVTEDDYFTGTGTSYYSRVNVSLTCTVYDENGDEITNDYRDSEFEKYLLN